MGSGHVLVKIGLKCYSFFLTVHEWTLPLQMFPDFNLTRSGCEYLIIERKPAFSKSHGCSELCISTSERGPPWFQNERFMWDKNGFLLPVSGDQKQYAFSSQSWSKIVKHYLIFPFWLVIGRHLGFLERTLVKHLSPSSKQTHSKDLSFHHNYFKMLI